MQSLDGNQALRRNQGGRVKLAILRVECAAYPNVTRSIAGGRSQLRQCHVMPLAYPISLDEEMSFVSAAIVHLWFSFFGTMRFYSCFVPFFNFFVGVFRDVVCHVCCDS